MKRESLTSLTYEALNPWPDHVISVCGGLSAVLGLVVIAGWHLNYPPLLRIFPAFEPMRYNTALSFLMSGFGLVFVRTGRMRGAGLCGLMVAGLGLLNILQYAFDLNIGIDQLLIKDTVSSSYPGRMALPTALAFIFTGAALLLSSGAPTKKRSFMLGLSGAVTASLGITAVLGYLTGVSAINVWGNFISMALHTAIGFVVIGAGVVAAVWKDGFAGAVGSRRWLAALIGIGVMTGTLILWRVSAEQEVRHIGRAVQFKTESVRDYIQDQNETIILALFRMARRWGLNDRPERAGWESDAALYVNHFEGYRAIEWIDPSFHARWAVPAKGGGGKDYGADPAARKALDAALSSRKAAVSPMIAAKDGSSAFMVCIPIFHGARFDGFIAGIFGARELFDSILKRETGAEYSIAVLNGGHEAYSKSSEGVEYDRLWQKESDLSVGNSVWRVRVAPAKEVLRNMRSRLPSAILITGAMFSVFLPLVIYLAETAQKRAKAAESMNLKLEHEIAERSKAEAEAERNAAELARSNYDLEMEIAERKRAEEAVEKHAKELERSNSELEQFAYVASHDLQEPLRIVAGYVQLLGKRYRGRLDPNADEFIAYAVDGATRMQRIINDLLVYSRVGRAKEYSPVDIEEVIKAAVGGLRASVEESGATVTWGPMPTLVADASQLDHLFINLLSNAIKYRGPRPPLITINAEEAPGQWQFSVSDNGIGIDSKYYGRIFVIFQRLHGKSEYPGTGIGLAICKKVVENHGGRIWVDSEPGKGCTFYFTIQKKEVNA